MNDFDYDVMQKKRVAAGARHRVNGSKSKFVSLPSDYMTAAEKRRLNGKVNTYKMNEPISYGEFKKMPTELQEKYLNGLNSRFGVGAKTIGEDLFHKSANALNEYIRAHGIKMARGNRLSEKERELWEAWLAGEDLKKPVLIDDIEEVIEPVVVKTLPKEENELKSERVSVCLTGKVTANALMKLFAGLCIPDGECRVFLEIQQIAQERNKAVCYGQQAD